MSIPSDLYGVARDSSSPVWRLLEGLFVRYSFRVLLVALVLITLAELLASLVSPTAALILHALILVGLIVYSMAYTGNAASRLALALALAPLTRLLSFGFPLSKFPPIAWYPLVAVPLLLALFMIKRELKMSTALLGIRKGSLRLQLLIGCAGFGLGFTQYLILRPEPMINSITAQNIWLPALILLVFTGFTEEVIYRGMLQSLAVAFLPRRWGLLYVSLLFAVMQIGFRSAIEVLFVFGVGLLFAYIVSRTGSILGVTLAHGLINIMVLLVMPNLAGAQMQLVPQSLLISLLLSVLLAASAVVWLVFSALSHPQSAVVSQSLTSSPERADKPCDVE